MIKRIKRRFLFNNTGVWDRAVSIKKAQERKLGEMIRREREIAMGVTPSESVVGTEIVVGRWREPSHWNCLFYYTEILPPHPDDRKWIGHFRVLPRGNSISDLIMSISDADAKRNSHVDLGDLQQEIYGRISPPRITTPEELWFSNRP